MRPNWLLSSHFQMITATTVGTTYGKITIARRMLRPGKSSLSNRAASNTQYDLEHDRRKRIDRAAPYRRPEFRIAQKKNIVVESDESLLWEERVLVEEADPDAVQHRIKRK